MLVWSLQKLELPLRFDCKTPMAEGEAARINFIVRIEDAKHWGEGEVAFPSLANQKTENLIEDYFDHFKQKWVPSVDGIAVLTGLLNDIGVPECLRFGIESAYIHYLANANNQSVHQILSLNQMKIVPTSFSIPVMGPEKLKEFYTANRLDRFKSLKVNIYNEDGIALVKEVVKLHGPRIRIDANASFQDIGQVLEMIEQVKSDNIEFLEQPLPVGAYEESKMLKKKSPVPIIADESITNGNVTKELGFQFDGVNIKLMKAGGYIKALNQMRMAKSLNMKVLLGSMIETGLGISSAVNIASKADYFDLDGFLTLGNNPYPLVEEENGNIFYSSIH